MYFDYFYNSVIYAYNYTGGYPYPSVSNSELLPSLLNGYRLECPKNCSKEMYGACKEVVAYSLPIILQL